MTPQTTSAKAQRLLDFLECYPAPILVKDEKLCYIWVNAAFERLFCVKRKDLIRKRDGEVFLQGQATQCASGDLRVLESGQPDAVSEIVVNPARGHREIVTRKERISPSDGPHFLVGVLDDVTPGETEAAVVDFIALQNSGKALLAELPCDQVEETVLALVMRALVHGDSLTPKREALAA